MDNWKCIAKTKNLQESELLAGLLESESIPCVVVNKQVSSYSFGYIELHVLSDDAFQASQIIKNEHQPESF